MSLARYLSKLGQLLNSSGQLLTAGHADASITPVKLSSDAQFMGFKNRIINGAFQVDQYSKFASHTVQNSNAVYVVDRFYAYSFGANVTGQIVAAVNAKRYRFTGASGCTGIGFGTRLEKANTYDLYGSNATFSIKASSSSLTSLTWTAYYANSDDNFGTLNSAAVTQIATGTFTINSTEATYSATFPVATATGICIVITGGALGAAATLTLGDLQLEKGSTATSFDYRPYGIESALCKRYLPIYNAVAVSEPIGTHSLFSATAGVAQFAFEVEPRVPPSGLIVTGTVRATVPGVSTFTVTPSLASSSLRMATLNLAGSGMSTGFGTLLSGSVPAQLQFTGCEL